MRKIKPKKIKASRELYVLWAMILNYYSILSNYFEEIEKGNVYFDDKGLNSPLSIYNSNINRVAEIDELFKKHFGKKTDFNKELRNHKARLEIELHSLGKTRDYFIKTFQVAHPDDIKSKFKLPQKDLDTFFATANLRNYYEAKTKLVEDLPSDIKDRIPLLKSSMTKFINFFEKETLSINYNSSTSPQ